MAPVRVSHLNPVSEKIAGPSALPISHLEIPPEVFAALQVHQGHHLQCL